ncbi:MAG: PTS glucitol/sorbitol transporter subunit IIB [Bombilactobacillus mellifer]|uniref:PTS glucitol/sorbitol transporter subunit IIB n=1 Tax=Bombilactobacillus mellifer TaxID=1218492 RepID=UPI0018DC3274|nr:PTS glucitol/sorbitol transporter subunit IIB [Bombilactobacillus mellifer]MBH9991151.1 PTS glucitol/sorbitol transporter subunit IIB [Lactobacillus sp. W8092]MCT6844415.1 PTS glucitol/sorbitol transporter subunit IIB [Bombilactobacillus mellifer]
MNYRSVTIVKGNHGWGGPLTITPTADKPYIISVTGGGIDPVAQKIADLTGAEVTDSFKNPVPKEKTCAAIIDCGGTARSGVYPKMGIPTVNTVPITPAGPLAQFIHPEIFVSGVTVEQISENTTATQTPAPAATTDTPTPPVQATADQTATAAPQDAQNTATSENNFLHLIDVVGQVAGDFVNTFYQAGRDTIDTLIKNILPFMAFVATLVGIINYSGIGKLLAHILSPLAGNIIGLVILSIICALPFLSPILGPAGVIAAVVGTLIGQQIASGTVPLYLALPALFAIDAQAGCDFIPVGLTLGEAEPETITSGTPAILFSRLLTAPVAVLIAFGFSFLLK